MSVGRGPSGNVSAVLELQWLAFESAIASFGANIDDVIQRFFKPIASVTIYGVGKS